MAMMPTTNISWNVRPNIRMHLAGWELWLNGERDLWLVRKHCRIRVQFAVAQALFEAADALPQRTHHAREAMAKEQKSHGGHDQQFPWSKIHDSLSLEKVLCATCRRAAKAD